jgi:hypothetical protein
MDDVQDAEPEPSPYLRLPWPLVATALVGVLALALAIGLLANRYLRPQVEVAPTPIAVAVAPVATPAPAPTAEPTRTIAPTSTPLVVTAAPTASPLTVTVTLTTAPTTTATPAARPTFDALLVAEVGKAYENYWQVRTQALLELDKTHLDEVMAGDHLGSVAQRIDELISENRAIKTDVDHDFRVVQVAGDDAQVLDDYISDSVYVDPATQLQLSNPTSDELRVLYRLSRFDGKWKVVDSVRAD